MTWSRSDTPCLELGRKDVDVVISMIEQEHVHLPAVGRPLCATLVSHLGDRCCLARPLHSVFDVLNSPENAEFAGKVQRTL